MPLEQRSRKRTWTHATNAEQRVRKLAIDKIDREIQYAFRRPDDPKAFEKWPEARVAAQETAAATAIAPVTSKPSEVRFPVPPKQWKSREHEEKKAAEQKQLFMRLLREQQRMRKEHMEMEVRALQQEIQQLQAYSRTLLTRNRFHRVNVADTVTSIMQSYFDVFRDGFHTSIGSPLMQQLAPSPYQPPIMTNRPARQPSSNDQYRFLSSVMVPDVITCSVMRGLDALVEQWARYDLYFNLHKYQLRRVEFVRLDDCPVLQLYCDYRVCITRKALEEVFPHVLQNEFLVQQLVGKELHCDSRATFFFNHESKIIRYDDDSDFCGALSRLITNPIDLAFIFDGARIEEQALIGPIAPSDRIPATEYVDVGTRKEEKTSPTASNRMDIAFLMS